MTKSKTKFADYLANISVSERAKLADSIEAAAVHLPAADLRALITALSAEVKAQESKTGKKAARLAKLHAAMAATDAMTERQVTVVSGELKRAASNVGCW